MVPIQLQMTLTLDQNSTEQLAEIVRKAIKSESQATAHNQRVAASQHALYGGEVPSDEEKRLLIDTREVARLLDVCDRTIFSMEKDGRMPPSIKIGRAVRWNLEELRAWVNEGCPCQAEWSWPARQNS